jgi:hypothetical protein
MPESEPKPRLIELVDPGVGQGWKAVLKNGKSVVVHEIPVPAAEAAGAVPRIQRLFEHRHPALSPVLAWGTDPNGLWVAVEPNEGVPLGTILSRGPLTPPAAAALGTALLSGVAALHETGIAMGGFGAAAVRITSNGEVRLAGHPAGAVRGAPSQSDLRADVRSSGMAICAAFGVDPAGAPAPPNIPPGLVVTMRSMASGAMGPAADRAQGALREMAAALLAPDRMTAAQVELATRSGGREMPAFTPILPQTETPAPAPAPAPHGPLSPREETPLPAPASYDPPPRPPAPQPSTPPTPSPYAPYSTPAPANPPAPPDAVLPLPLPIITSPPVPAAVTAPPAPAPSPFGATVPPPAQPGTSAPPPSPFGTNAPAPPTWETAAPAPAQAPPTWDTPAPAPAPVPVPEEAAPTAATYEPPAATPSYVAPAATPAPSTIPPEQTWTPIATPAWTPNDAPALATGAGAAAAAGAATSTAPPSAPARKPSTTRPYDREPRERPAWLLPAIIALVILLLLGAGGGIYLATRGHAPAVGKITKTPKPPKSTPKATPSPTNNPGPLAVPTYAPSSAAPVTGVAFLPDTVCHLNSRCTVDVEMKYSPAQSGQLGYVLKFFDRCTGTTTTLPGRAFKTQTAFVRADPGFETVTLPAGAKSAAIVAVSSTPAAAASAPLLLGSDTC